MVGRRKKGGGVEINSLHSEDRYDTPRKYSTALEIDTTVNLSASPAALWRIGREEAVAKSKISILSLFWHKMMTQNLRHRTIQLPSF